MTPMTQEEINKRIIKSFFDSKEKIHILRNKRNSENHNIFRNGFIFKAYEDFFVFDDEIVGKENIFYFECKKIEEYIPSKEYKWN